MEAVPTPITEKKHIKITFEQLQPGGFMQAFGRLTSYDKFSSQTLYRLTKIAKKISKERSIMEDMRLDLIKKHAAQDEKGNLIPREGKDGKPEANTFTIPPENQEAWDKAAKAFDKTEVEIDMWPLDVAALSADSFPMSPQILMVLEPIVQVSDE